MIKVFDLICCYIHWFDKKTSHLICILSCMSSNKKYYAAPKKTPEKPPMQIFKKSLPSIFFRERSRSCELWDRPKNHDDILRDIPLFPIKSVTRPSKTLTPFMLPMAAKPAHLSPERQTMDISPTVTPFQQRLFTPRTHSAKLGKVEIARVFNNNDKTCPPTVEKPRNVNRKLYRS